MSHLSPASLLVWAILSTLVEMFLIFHLWSFDKFKCLRWNQSIGTFKRVMTYSYLLSVPLTASYSIGLSAIKYHEGFLDFPPQGIIPRPIDLWSPLTRNFNFPLMLCLSIGWSLEMVTHLEELCFWLFLLNASSRAQQNWFQSLYFKTWVAGSLLAITYMPIITVLTRSDPLKSEAYTFLAGSMGSLSLTICFTPILFLFPSFLHNLRRESVDKDTIVRLTKSSEMNIIRVFFRFLFTIPILILAVDGIRPHHHINENMFWTDFLVMLSGFGCAISSTITLVIFFPRSIEGEIVARDGRKRSKSRNSDMYRASWYGSRNELTLTNATQHSRPMFNYGTPVLDSKLFVPSSPSNNFQLGKDDNARYIDSSAVRVLYEPDHTGSTDKSLPDEQGTPASLLPLKPNRKKGHDVEAGINDQIATSNMAELNPYTSNVHHLVHNFISPIDLFYSDYQAGREWLSFSRS